MNKDVVNVGRYPDFWKLVIFSILKIIQMTNFLYAINYDSWLFHHFEFYEGRLFGGEHAYKTINLSVSQAF